MALSEYLRILRRWGWIVVLMALLTAGSAYVFSAAQTKVYRSTVNIGIEPYRPDFGLTQSARSLLRYYVAVASTEKYAQQVIDRLSLDRTKESLLGDVTIASDDSRFTIQIDVDNQNGDVANDIARVWADEFIAWRNEQNAKVRREDQVGAVMLDDPKYSLFRPRTSVNTLAGGILGVLLGGVLVFALEYSAAAVIRSPEDVEKGLGLPVLGAIPPAVAAARGAGAGGPRRNAR
jgi:capsular polysaccharide biosynthesis protein